MANILDAQGRSVDTLLTPQQNLAMHQQTRQLIQTGLQQLGGHFQEMFYKQALFLEYLTLKIQNSGVDIDPDGFAAWAQAKHEEIQALQAEEDRAAAAALLAEVPGVQLND